jgi:hypothetical protein
LCANTSGRDSKTSASRGLAVEVGDQVFDAGRRVELLDGAHRRGVGPGTAVGQVVAGDAGDRGIAQSPRPQQVNDGVDVRQRVSTELVALGISVQFGGIRRRPAHDAQHRVSAARSVAAKAEPIGPDEPGIATTALATFSQS